MDTEKFSPLQGGGFIVLRWCFLLAIFVTPLILFAVSGFEKWQLGLISSLISVLLSIGSYYTLVDGAICGDEFFSFREYLKRNILGYYKVLVFQQGPDSRRLPEETIGVSRLTLSQVMEPSKDGQGCKIRIAIPYGGWLAKPRMTSSHDELRGWKLSSQEFFHEDPETLPLRLSDHHGSRLSCVTAREVGGLLGLFTHTYPIGKQVSLTWCSLLVAEGSLQVQKLTSDLALGALFEAVKRIEESKRFLHSKEGKEVCGYMLCELLRILPKDDPRKAELERKVAELELRKTMEETDEIKI